jgi:hypothetical protein
MAQGPGPPQRPHIGGASDADLLDPSDETAAKMLRARAVSSDPHFGQATGSLDDIERTSFSNLVPQGLHWYS